MLPIFKTKRRTDKQRQGDIAEQQSLAYLKKQGLKFKDKNYNCRLGEIDLIMLDKNTLVFIEVRFRTSNQHGNGADSVDYHKQRKIIKTASHYLQAHKLTDKYPCRFDVVSASNNTNSVQLQLEWIKDAFQVMI